MDNINSNLVFFRKKYRLVNLYLFLILIAILVVPALLNFGLNANIEQNLITSWLPSCFVKQHTGHDCSSCGLTRSVLALYKGNFSKSQDYHPYGFLILLVFWCELVLRILPETFVNVWIPWLDIFQMILVGGLLKVFFFM